MKKWVPNFDDFFDRVPKLILELLGGENDTKKPPELVKIRAKGPKHRILANMQNPLRLPIKTRVRISKKSTKVRVKAISFINRYELRCYGMDGVHTGEGRESR